ncbi:hypothetical protein GRB70_03280 [Bradyrhizobium neotropicale]|nr:hypothetical protein [Bradyrhizobium neotropicale]
MFNTTHLNDELQALKIDVSRLFNTTDEGIRDTASADAFTTRIKEALEELSEVLSGEDTQVRQLISERPITSLASAFALGVVVGFAMRR